MAAGQLDRRWTNGARNVVAFAPEVVAMTRSACGSPTQAPCRWSHWRAKSAKLI